MNSKYNMSRTVSDKFLACERVRKLPAINYEEIKNKIMK